MAETATGPTPGRKALLVYPEFTLDSFWNFRPLHARIFPRNRHGYAKGAMPPLGLLSIAGAISGKYGRENVRLVDMNVQPLREEDLLWADDVYLSAMLTQAASFDEVAARAKARGKTTIGGGPYVDEERTPNLDYVFLNEAEHSLEPFLDELFDGRPRRVHRADRPTGNAFWRPDYSWIRLDDYATVGLQFSRGCPHDCEFCDITVRYGRKMRAKDVDVFLAELDEVYAAGWRGLVFIIDDNFIGKPRQALELNRALAEWQRARGYPFEFTTQATVLLADDSNRELLASFHPAGFGAVFLGIETPSRESLEETHKLHNLRPGADLAQNVRKIQRNGRLLVYGGFIVGFDHDGEDVFEQQARFIQDELQLPTPTLSMLEPLPQTNLHRRLLEEGRLLRVSSGTLSAGQEYAFQPRRLTTEQLRDGYLALLERIYFDIPTFYRKCEDALGFAGPARLRSHATRDMAVALLSLLVAEGIQSPHRWRFWRFLLGTAVRRPRTLPFALRLVAYGLHYRMTAERVLTRHRADRLGAIDHPAPA